MTKQEALLYLSSTEENWEEELELLIFELKRDLFRRVLIPKLLLKKAEKVAIWYEAAQVLKGEPIEALDNLSLNLECTNSFLKEDILKLYRDFESELMQLQLKLSQSSSPKVVSEMISSIANLEISRQNHLLPLAKQIFVDLDEKFEVKISEDAQTGVIISELKHYKKESFSEKNDLLLLPNFTKDLQRIIKSN